ncbi:MAG: iron-sulfur cluster assembly accessory protein [Holosporales bacterium]|nr:iron-sulfur cluster assembly accessory protein [Holosporales bacterium]
MITMTQQAVEKLKEMIGAQNATGILVTVESGGCSGIRYSLSYEMEPDDSKTGITINDIKFYFDTKDEPIIDGLTIDIVDHDFGRGFSVTNNRHSSCQNCTCGCRPR